MAIRKTTSTLLGFSVFQRYRAPLQKVWDAATQAKHLNRFFTTRARGDISPKNTAVHWQWGTVSAELEMQSCEVGKHFEFRWIGIGQKDLTTVRFEFARERGYTVVRIFEAGWKPKHVDGAFDHCSGWSEFLYGLKAYVQHGIDLRK